MNKLPKLVAFVNSYSHGKSGGDMVFVEVAKRIVGFRIVVITSLLGKELCQNNNLSAQFIITSREKEFRNTFLIYIKRTITALLLRINTSKNDVLLGTSDFFPDVLPIFFIKLFNPTTKWIQHVFHIIPNDRKVTHRAQQLSFVLIKQFADSIIVDNNLLKSELVQLGFNKDKIQVNYPGININDLNKYKAHPIKSYEGIFMAQLRESKGIFDLIKIWNNVSASIPNAKLAIIGKGEQKNVDKIKELIQRYQLEDNIELLGFLNDEIAFPLIKSSKVFVFPSHEEGFGIAPLEAQCLGVPVIAWNLPVFHEIFPKGMIKIPIRNYNRFAQKVIDLLKSSVKLSTYSVQAKENSSRFDWSKTAMSTSEIINKLLNR